MDEFLWAERRVGMISVVDGRRGEEWWEHLSRVRVQSVRCDNNVRGVIERDGGSGATSNGVPERGLNSIFEAIFILSIYFLARISLEPEQVE